MEATGVCQTDVLFRGAPPLPTPIVLGHEGAGIVEAIGEGVEGLTPGDRVVLSFSSCQSCRNCRASLPSYCTNFGAMNVAGFRPDGSTPITLEGAPVSALFFGQSSFGTFALTRSSNVVKVDTSVPPEILAPLGCGIQTGAGTVLNVLDASAGDQIVVFGAGSVGLSAVMAAAARGAAIVVVEPNAARRELALELGAAAALDPTGADDLRALVLDATGGGVHGAFDTTGNAVAIRAASEALLPNATLALVGFPQVESDLPVSLRSMAMRGANISFVSEGDSDPATFIPELIGMYSAGRFPLDRLVTTFPFDQINAAFDAASSATVIKPVLVF